MGFLLKLLTLPVSGPLNGVTWLAEQIEGKAEAELYDVAKLQGQLMDLEMRLDMGEIEEETYELYEMILLERLQIARERQAEQNNE